MSNSSVSRGSTTPTLADALGAIAAAPGLSKAQRQDLASAVRTVARVLGKPPELMPADPVLLGRRLAEVSPLARGLSKGRWANVRSLTLKALALTRPMLPGRHRAPLSPGWQVLSDGLPSRGQATRLSRLLHWLSARGIEPEMVTAAALEAFGAELREASLAKKPEETWRGVVWVWNKASRTVPGWPAVMLVIPRRRQPYTFDWSAFPPPLKADVDRYLDRLAGRDLLEDLPFRPARPETVAFRERQLRSFASALVHRGREAASLRSIADLVEITTFKDGLRFFLERNGGASSVYIYNIASALKAIARHHVRADEATLNQMQAIIKRLEVPTRGLTRKNRDRLRPFDDEANVEALIALPQRLMKEANSGKLGSRPAALLAQTAVAIEILLMAPLRLKNLLQLELGVHLIESGPNMSLVFEWHEMKTGSAMDMPLPSESAKLIKHYSDRYRPCLTTPENRKLFPGQGGGAKSRSTFRQQLGRTIHRHTGLKMNPHLFRHARVKIHLDRYPGEYAIASAALGHASIDTTRNFYGGLEGAAAMRHFDKVILELRREFGRGRP